MTPYENLKLFIQATACVAFFIATIWGYAIITGAGI